MRDKLFFLIISLFFLSGNTAQGSDYDDIKSAINENSLPLVNITVDVNKLSADNYISGTIEICDYLCRTDNKQTVYFDCLAKYHGASSIGLDKKSFSIKLIDTNSDDLDVNVMGIREDNNWILNAMAIDKARMRNMVCFDIWNDMSKTPYDTDYENRNGTKGVFVEVFLNGEYHGLYSLSDKIERKLLGLKKVKEQNNGTITVRGLLYKDISWADGCHLNSYSDADMNNLDWGAWELKYPDDYPSVQTWQPLADLIDFCASDLSDEEYTEEYKSHFYPQNIIDYLTFTNALYIRDTAYKNTYLSTIDVTDIARFMITPWDLDASLGDDWDGSYITETVNVNRFNDISPFNRLYAKDLDLTKENVKQCWQTHCNNVLSKEKLASRLDSYASQFKLSGAWARERAKWNNNPVELKENIDDELQIIKDWYSRNYESLCEVWGHYGTEDLSFISNNDSDSEIFSIDGRKVGFTTDNLPKGIYIKGNKKIIIK